MRAAERDRLALHAPAEIAPLVEEVDALIAQNRATVERARAHVGNLAHALKTPVAVLNNALDGAEPRPEVALRQAKVIERVVHHHLARARSAAQPGPGSLNGRASPRAVAEEVAAALRRLQAERGLAITVEGEAALRVLADRQDLIEIVGNLMENARKWAASRVEVRVAPAGGASGPAVAVVVEDDGPGLLGGRPAAEALARGVRFDEAVPGTGLGLAIVADLHGGRLVLGRSDRLAGASATLELPAATSAPDAPRSPSVGTTGTSGVGRGPRREAGGLAANAVGGRAPDGTALPRGARAFPPSKERSPDGRPSGTGAEAVPSRSAELRPTRTPGRPGRPGPR